MRNTNDFLNDYLNFQTVTEIKIFGWNDGEHKLIDWFHPLDISNDLLTVKIYITEICEKNFYNHDKLSIVLFSLHDSLNKIAFELKEHKQLYNIEFYENKVKLSNWFKNYVAPWNKENCIKVEVQKFETDNNNEFKTGIVIKTYKIYPLLNFETLCSELNEYINKNDNIRFVAFINNAVGYLIDFKIKK